MTFRQLILLNFSLYFDKNTPMFECRRRVYPIFAVGAIAPCVGVPAKRFRHCAALHSGFCLMLRKSGAALAPRFCACWFKLTGRLTPAALARYDSQSDDCGTDAGVRAK